MNSTDIQFWSKVEEWNCERLLAQVTGNIAKEKKASRNLNYYLRKAHLPEIDILRLNKTKQTEEKL